MNQRDKQSLIIHTDGGARGNPGPAAIGVFVQDKQGDEIARFGKFLGEATNNVAEYQAVIEALEWVKNNFQNKSNEIKEIKFFLDSMLVVNQLRGVFKIKEPHLRELFLKIKILEQEIRIKTYYEYIPREKNKTADLLVNSTLDASTK